MNWRTMKLCIVLVYPLVGLGVGRSVESIIGVLAILRAGAAYLPLDPTYPEARLHFMVQDSGVKLILCDAGFHAVVGELPDRSLIRLDEFDWGAAEPPGSPVESRVGPDDPAYVLYTSGSTGQPKSATGW